MADQLAVSRVEKAPILQSTDRAALASRARGVYLDRDVKVSSNESKSRYSCEYLKVAYIRSHDRRYSRVVNRRSWSIRKRHGTRPFVSLGSHSLVDNSHTAAAWALVSAKPSGGAPVETNPPQQVCTTGEEDTVNPETKLFLFLTHSAVVSISCIKIALRQSPRISPNDTRDQGIV